jgi:hypothetical protein
LLFESLSIRRFVDMHVVTAEAAEPFLGKESAKGFLDVAIAYLRIYPALYARMRQALTSIYERKT